jgi:hypothetical protein
VIQRPTGLKPRIAPSSEKMMNWMTQVTAFMHLAATKLMRAMMLRKESEAYAMKDMMMTTSSRTISTVK